jgi:hypothetical protein
VVGRVGFVGPVPPPIGAFVVGETTRAELPLPVLLDLLLD